MRGRFAASLVLLEVTDILPVVTDKNTFRYCQMSLGEGGMCKTAPS